MNKRITTRVNNFILKYCDTKMFSCVVTYKEADKCIAMELVG